MPICLVGTLLILAAVSVRPRALCGDAPAPAAGMQWPAGMADQASDRARVASILAGHNPTGTDHAFAAAVRQCRQLGGRFAFDRQGRLTAVDLTAGRTSVADAEVHLLASLPPLSTIKVAGGGITNRSVPTLIGHKHLRALVLLDVQMDHTGFRQLAGLQQLESLRIRQAPHLTDADLDLLKQFPRLRYLELIDNNFTDQGIPSVAELDRLRLLDLRGCAEITDDGIAQLARMTSLSALRIGSPSIGDASITALARSSRIRRLTIDHAAVTDVGLSQLDPLPLEELNLVSCLNVTDRGLQAVARLLGLRTLRCSDMFFSAAGLTEIGQLTQLRTLQLNQLIGLGDAELALLIDGPRGQAGQPQTGPAGGGRVTGGTVRNLARLVRLELQRSQISGASLARIATLTNLEHLDVAGTRIGSADLRHLAALSKLQVLDLHDNGGITDAAVDNLARLSTLRQLDLRGTAMTPAGVDRLRTALPGCSIRAMQHGR